jgi:radical SAM superfamily enzyme YgiQ (UPF0313 family)
MRVVFISPYNDRCYGVRIIMPWLRQHGHEAHLICFKKFLGIAVAPDDKDTWRRVMSASYLPVLERHEEADWVVPYIAPATDREWQLLLQKTRDLKPDMIGLTVPSNEFDEAVKVTARVREEVPGVPVLWGGIHAIAVPDECIRHADIVAVDEAEHALVELCADPRRTDIRGLWFRRNGEVIKNPVRPLEQNLDLFPFASYGIDEWLIEDDTLTRLTLPEHKEHLRASYLMISQRGCPFKCTYCVHHLQRSKHPNERYLRRRSVDHVIAEARQRVADLDMPGFPFLDEVFAINPQWCDEFCEKWPKAIGLPFGGYTYPLVATEEMYRKLQKAGMAFIGIGIQTGSDRLGREVYGRVYTSDKLVELAEIGAKLGFNMSYELLSGCPYESEEDCLETLKLLLRMPRPMQLMVKKVRFFPNYKINFLDIPRPNLSEERFNFYIMLYLLSRHHLVPPESLIQLAQDEFLKQHPEALGGVALGLRRAIEQRDTLYLEVAELKAQIAGLAAHSQAAPSLGGLLDYAKRLVMTRLPAPLAEPLRALRRKLRPQAHPPVPER